MILNDDDFQNILIDLMQADNQILDTDSNILNFLINKFTLIKNNIN